MKKPVRKVEGARRLERAELVKVRGGITATDDWEAPVATMQKAWKDDWLAPV